MIDQLKKRYQRAVARSRQWNDTTPTIVRDLELRNMVRLDAQIREHEQRQSLQKAA
jgi:hypothetical protein